MWVMANLPGWLCFSLLSQSGNSFLITMRWIAGRNQQPSGGVKSRTETDIRVRIATAVIQVGVQQARIRAVVPVAATVTHP